MPMAPSAVVSGAARLTLPFGLFSQVTMRPAGDRWESGVTWESLTCDPVGGLGSPDVLNEGPGTTVGLPKTLTGNVGSIGTALPFTVYGHFTASPAAFTPEAAEQRALDHLQTREEARVEQALWTGDLGNAPSLDAAPTDLTGATAVAVGTALGLLEEHIASTYGSLGMIHLTRAAALAALAGDWLEARSGRLFTRLGTPVIAGSGYPGTGPAGSAIGAGEAWAFSSPALFGYRGAPFSSSNRSGDLLAKGTNDLYAVAERTYLLGYDGCGVGAALMDVATDAPVGS